MPLRTTAVPTNAAATTTQNLPQPASQAALPIRSAVSRTNISTNTNPLATSASVAPTFTGNAKPSAGNAQPPPMSTASSKSDSEKDGEAISKPANRHRRDLDVNECSLFEGGLYKFRSGNQICRWALTGYCAKWATGRCSMRHHIWHDGLNAVVDDFLNDKPSGSWTDAVKHVQTELKRQLDNNEHSRNDTGARKRQQKELQKPSAPPAQPATQSKTPAPP